MKKLLLAIALALVTFNVNAQFSAIQDGGRKFADIGAPTTPAYTFAADPDTGMYAIGTGSLAFTNNGSPTFVIRPGGFFNILGTAPTMGACGTSPSVVGTNSAFQATVGTGGVATSCVINFSASWSTNPPTCVAQNNTDRVAYNIVTTLTSVTVNATAAFTAGSIFHVICFGRN